MFSLIGSVAGDSKIVQAFKRGYNGESAELKEYTFTNDMGCTQTVYSADGREFYDANGAYVGSSDNGGRTIDTSSYGSESAVENEYTYTDANGYSQTVYSSDGKEFYDAGGAYVGKSYDGGKTIINE